eukprot:TRINITY_DN2672_c0_g1_i4.p1 TRINITY_DN2672_c0_g1~~TRINITY_DN2672_c0_g1_i4.p1  ORF type:complete len:255 (+),score=83.10 TRINITY_DN2672_c0_g1_i4:385-1149(+)
MAGEKRGTVRYPFPLTPFFRLYFAHIGNGMDEFWKDPEPYIRKASQTWVSWWGSDYAGPFNAECFSGPVGGYGLPTSWCATEKHNYTQLQQSLKDSNRDKLDENYALPPQVVSNFLYKDTTHEKLSLPLLIVVALGSFFLLLTIVTVGGYFLKRKIYGSSSFTFPDQSQTLTDDQERELELTTIQMEEGIQGTLVSDGEGEGEGEGDQGGGGKDDDDEEEGTAILLVGVDATAADDDDNDGEKEDSSLSVSSSV